MSKSEKERIEYKIRLKKWSIKEAEKWDWLLSKWVIRIGGLIFLLILIVALLFERG